MKIGVIGLPGKWSSETLADAVEQKTNSRLLFSIEDISLDLTKGTAHYKDLDLLTLDGIIVKKLGEVYTHHLLDRVEILRFLERKGVRIFSPAESIRLAVDRLTCTLELRRGDIPMPETVITENVEEACRAVEKFGSAVFKPIFTSKARGMKIISWGADTAREVEEYKKENNTIMYIQRKREISGKDFGVVFLGGKYLTTYARMGNKDSWTTTTHFGGKYSPYEPSVDIIKLAEKAQGLFGLDFTCVDVAETEDGPIVFEVSAFGGFRGIQEASGIDAAALYTDYAIQRIENGN